MQWRKQYFPRVQQWLSFDVVPPHTELGPLCPVPPVVVCRVVLAKITQKLVKSSWRSIRKATILKFPIRSQPYSSTSINDGRSEYTIAWTFLSSTTFRRVHHAKKKHFLVWSFGSPRFVGLRISWLYFPLCTILQKFKIKI